MPFAAEHARNYLAEIGMVQTRVTLPSPNSVGNALRGVPGRTLGAAFQTRGTPRRAFPTEPCGDCRSVTLTFDELNQAQKSTSDPFAGLDLLIPVPVLTPCNTASSTRTIPSLAAYRPLLRPQTRKPVTREQLPIDRGNPVTTRLQGKAVSSTSADSGLLPTEWHDDTYPIATNDRRRNPLPSQARSGGHRNVREASLAGPLILGTRTLEEQRH